MVSAVSTTLASTSSIENELCSVRARSRMARSFAEIAAYTHGRRGLFSAAHLLHQALEFRAVQRKQELVGILRAEFHAVRILQFLAL